MSLLPLLLLLVAAPPVHDYHVSKTNVRYVTETGQVQVEMHLFVDDMEADMMAAGAPDNLETGTQQEHPEAERYVSSYLDRHFIVSWNGERLPLELVGYELADDLHGLWLYLAAPAPTAPTAVAVDNTLLTATYPDQKNIVKFFVGEERSATLLLSKDRPRATHEF